MVIKFEMHDPFAPDEPMTAYELDARETRLFRQYQIATYGATFIVPNPLRSVITADQGQEQVIESMLALAGLNIKEDRTQKS